MVKNSIITALLSTALASGASAGSRDVQKVTQFFQNIKAEHVGPLLDGSAYVSHEDYNKLGKSRTGGEVFINWYRNGKRYNCGGAPSRNIPYRVSKNNITGKVVHSKKLRAKYHIQGITTDGNDTPGGELLRYDADSGALTHYHFHENRWWEMATGHLQSELPAVTWDLCPDFPSATSLGARVNKKQTAKFYKALVAQDPGKRVLKPEYEAAKGETVIWSDAGGKQQKRQQRRKDRNDR